MPLNKPLLEQAIVAAFTRAASNTDEKLTPQQAIQQISADIATAVDAFVRTGQVNIVAVPVVTPAGPGTATGVATIS